MSVGANNVIRIPTSLDNFFRHWINFLSPFHTLTEREMDIVASFLKQRYLLSKVITDESILDKVVMSEDTKKKVREECNLTHSHFQVIMAKLRKSKVVDDNKLNPKFIPNIIEDDKSFKLLMLFELK